MGKKRKILRQANGTWRLVLDMTPEQASKFNQLLGWCVLGDKVDRLLYIMRYGTEPRLEYLGVDDKWHEIKMPSDGDDSSDANMDGGDDAR